MAMTESIAQAGVLTPIRLYEGKILDGWHRYTIAQGMGLPCPSKPFEGSYDAAIAHVAAAHTRRNLKQGELALATLRMRKSAPGALSMTLAEQAAAIGVSERTMDQASVVDAKGSEELLEAVSRGDVSLKKAEQIARLPKEVQAQAIKGPLPAPWDKPAKPAKKAKPATPPAVVPQIGASIEALDELKERNAILVEEHERMEARLAVAAMDATQEEREAAASMIAGLQRELLTARAELDAQRAVAATLRAENNELLKQCAMYRNRLAKFSKDVQPA